MILPREGSLPHNLESKENQFSAYPVATARLVNKLLRRHSAPIRQSQEAAEVTHGLRHIWQSKYAVNRESHLEIFECAL